MIRRDIGILFSVLTNPTIPVYTYVYINMHMNMNMNMGIYVYINKQIIILGMNAHD
jgi:hypothetical protein